MTAKPSPSGTVRPTDGDRKKLRPHGNAVQDAAFYGKVLEICSPEAPGSS